MLSLKPAGGGRPGRGLSPLARVSPDILPAAPVSGGRTGHQTLGNSRPWRCAHFSVRRGDGSGGEGGLSLRLAGRQSDAHAPLSRSEVTVDGESAPLASRFGCAFAGTGLFQRLRGTLPALGTRGRGVQLPPPGRPYLLRRQHVVEKCCGETGDKYSGRGSAPLKANLSGVSGEQQLVHTRRVCLGPRAGVPASGDQLQLVSERRAVGDTEPQTLRHWVGEEPPPKTASWGSRSVLGKRVSHVLCEHAESEVREDMVISRGRDSHLGPGARPGWCPPAQEREDGRPDAGQGGATCSHRQRTPGLVRPGSRPQTAKLQGNDFRQLVGFL